MPRSRAGKKDTEIGFMPLSANGKQARSVLLIACLRERKSTAPVDMFFPTYTQSVFLF